MTTKPLGAAVRYLRTLTDLHSAAAAGDGQLLNRFVRLRDEAAFAALLRRHGPMVLAVCRRVLGRYQDAEDAFQATFLLLARKASSIRKRESVGGWLHGVARRLALKANGRDDRRRMNEERLGSMRKTETGVQAAWGDLREALDEALQRLPEHYRTALVICHLEGRTHEEAARQLGCPTATLRSRLTRGRKLLRAELIRRGLTLSVGALGAALLVSTAEAAPTLLIDATLKAALLFAAGKATAGAISTTAVALANESLKAVGIMKMKIGVMLLVALSLAGVGVGAMAQPAAKPPEEKPPPVKPQAETARKNETQVRVDDYGDPLPEGAVRRVGTLRFRQGGGQFNSLLVPSDGKTLVAGDFYGDRTICLWDLASGKLLRSFPGSWWNVRIALSPNGTTIAGAIGNDAVGLWDLATGKESRRLECKGHCPEGFAFSPDGRTLAAGGAGGFVDFWDLTTGKRIERRKTHLNRVTLLAFTPDGKTLALGDWAEDTITLWDEATSKEIRRLTRPGEVWQFVMSPDGGSLVTLGKKGKELEVLRLWEISTGKLLYEVPTIDQAEGVAFSPDGKTLASAEFDDNHAVLVLRDAKSGKVRRSNPIPQFAECLAYSADGKTLISGCVAGVIRLWDAETGKERVPTGGRWWNGNAVLSPDGKTLAYVDRDIRFWDMAAECEAGRLPSSEDGNMSLSFTPDGKTLASAGVNALFFWDISTRKLVRRIERDAKQTRNWFEWAAYSPDGKTLASAEYDGLIRLWDAASGKELRQCKFQKEVEEKMGRTASGLAFSPDGRTLAASGDPNGISSNRVRLWDVTSTEHLLPLVWEIDTPYEGNNSPSGSPWLNYMASKIAFSPDGRMLAMNRYQKTIPVWEAATGKQRLLLTGHTESTCCVAFAPDGRTLASSGYDDTIRLWDMVTGDELRTLRGHRGKANSLAFSADGKTLVSTGDDTTMLFWDVAEITHGPKPKALPLSPEECNSLWTDLANADAAKAYKAIRAFSVAPAQTASFLGERLRPARSAKKEVVDRFIADLDSDDFTIRDKATSELEELGDTVQPVLRKVIDGQPSAEVRSRMNRLLEKLATPAPELLRHLRALEALEAVGGAEARRVVEKIAKGDAEARRTREAKASLKRMGG